MPSEKTNEKHKFVHNVSYCARQAKCVKCGREQLTEDWVRKRSDDPCKYVNCGWGHTANRKALLFYKENPAPCTGVKTKMTATKRTVQKKKKPEEQNWWQYPNRWKQ